MKLSHRVKKSPTIVVRPFLYSPTVHSHHILPASGAVKSCNDHPKLLTTIDANLFANPIGIEKKSVIRHVATMQARILFTETELQNNQFERRIETQG